MSQFKTAGELFVFRNLEMETRAGIPQYKTGQHKARIVKDLAQLSYVDIAGHLVILVVHKRDDEWMLAVPSGVRFNQYMVEVVPFPRHFKLTDLMVRCLQAEEAAQASKKGKKRAAAQGGKSRATATDEE